MIVEIQEMAKDHAELTEKWLLGHELFVFASFDLSLGFLFLINICSNKNFSVVFEI